MAYDPSDLRSQLSTAGATATLTRSAGANVAPQYFEFDQMAPSSLTDAGSSLWWVRSQTCVANYARARAGDPLERRGQADEYVVLLPDTAATLTAGAEEVTAPARAVVVMPPGDSTVTLNADGQVLRLFSTESADLCDLCANQDFYADPDPNVAPFAAWPDPPDGHRIRVYALDEVERDPNRFGRLFRCSTVMVNYFYEDPGPRDPHKLSPHHHDDFEQLSLQLGGDYVHHIRTPWTVDMDQWREDEHQRCTTPSITVIPPPSIHTSQGVGDTPHQLVDIFVPPRIDFSERPGWVLNADEYPMPTS
jgi:hypothetical protein